MNEVLVNQTSSSPTRKVAYGAATGTGVGVPLAVVLIYLYERATGDVLPSEVAGAAGALISLIVGYGTSYMTKSRYGEA